MRSITAIVMLLIESKNPTATRCQNLDFELKERGNCRALCVWTSLNRTEYRESLL